MTTLRQQKLERHFQSTVQMYYCATEFFYLFRKAPINRTKQQTSGYDTWFTAGGAIRIAHYDVIDDVITRKL